MLSFAASVAQFRFECSALAPDTFTILGFTGEEAISRPFRFDFELVSTESDVPGADVVGKPATLHLGGDRKVHGVVSHFQQTERTATHFGYRVAFVPRLWVLSLTYQSEIYQKLSVQEILERVFQQAGWSAQDYRFELAGSYPPGEYVTQYQETNLAFVSRLMEQRGIFHYAWHDERDVLVIGDDSREAPWVDRMPVPFNAATSLNALLSWSIHEFTGHERLVPGQVVVKDYNYRTPNTPLVGEGENEGYAEATYYEYGGHFKDQTEADGLARLRAQELEAGRRVFEGKSNYPLMQPGFAFELEGHFRSRYNAKYLVTSVRHTGSHRGAVSPLAALSDGDEETYANDFTCIPLDVPYRPPRLTPVPRMPAVTTARVETAGGIYAHLDEEGRYHAKMAYDRSDASNGEASRPIRMSQPYSGAGYGIHFPNHADTELLVAHMNDDPDRPMALGTVPNPSNKTPVTAENKHQNVIRSQGGNELTLDDKKGSENIYMFGTKDHTVEITHDETITIGHDRSLRVERDEKESIRRNRTIEVTGFHQETIGGTMTLDVGASKSETIATISTLTIGTIYDVTVGAVMNETVGGAKTEQVGGIKAETIGAAKTEVVGAAKSVSVGADLTVRVGKNTSTTVADNVTEKVGGKHSEEVAKEYALSAKKIMLTAQDEIVIKTGSAEIVMKKSGDITIKGKKIQIKGDGDVIIKGSSIKEN